MRQLVLLIIIILVIIWVTSFYILKWQSKEEVKIIINHGDSVERIAQKLKEAGAIPNKFFFKITVLFFDYRKLKAGEYVFNKGINTLNIVNRLSIGPDTFREKTIKVIEGWTIEDIDEYLSKNNFFETGEFAAEARDIEKWRLNYDFLQNEKVVNLEGYLFPDTYRIYAKAGASDLIKKMLDNFSLKLTAQIKQDINQKKLVLYDVIILASIIEKEVRTDKDREIVSGIFWKRLRSGMPLQADSTLNYFTHNNSFRLSQDELKIDSKYNTYMYQGLPPTPIANPGIKSIQAAVYPLDSPYLYFLSKENNGESVFSKTFDEHVRNKRKWLK